MKEPAMKKLIITIVLVMTAAAASAQEIYTFSVGGTTTNRASVVGQIELGRVQWNTEVCKNVSLPASCTQAQACVGHNTAGGAACTAQQALDGNVRIFPDSEAGRSSFVANIMVRNQVAQFLSIQIAKDQADALAAWQAKNAADKDAICATLGMPAGCFAWPR